MITNTIASPEFDALLQEFLEAHTQLDGSDIQPKLVAFIDAWGLSIKHQAVEEFKAVCKFQGLVAVDHNKLDAVLLASDIPKSVQAALDTLKRLDVFDSMKRVPDDLTSDFTIEADAQLNELLNASVHMALYGGNMDTGLHWSDCLENVLKRLRPPEEEEDQRDLAVLQSIRYRLHRTVDNVLGRDVLIKFKQGSLLRDLDTSSAIAVLFSQLENEFNCTVPASLRQKFMLSNFDQIADMIYDHEEDKEID